MNPVKTALWISKFVVMLALLLVVIPTVLFYGGVFAAMDQKASLQWPG
jgi:hypothetical protein